jgi:zinc and cadmium transporter
MVSGCRSMPMNGGGVGCGRKSLVKAGAKYYKNCMNNPWVSSLLSVAAVSAISLIGLSTLAIRSGWLKPIILMLVSFAVGALFGDAFIHILPEAFEKTGNPLAVSLYLIGGILIFFILEKFLRWRHCHDNECSEHVQPVVAMNLLGDAVHNFIDGMIIAASYLVSVPIGFATTVAVILHEIPQEFGDFGVLVNGGLTPRRAIFFNFLSALTSFAGAVLSLAVGPHLVGYTAALLPLTAGGFIYIAGSDLIPELHHHTSMAQSLMQFAMIVAGVGMMALLLVVG